MRRRESQNPLSIYQEDSASGVCATGQPHLEFCPTDIRKGYELTAFDKARDELFSHILRCEVVGSEPEHQREWFDDTMEYMAERYSTLSQQQLTEIRNLGERYVQPVIPHDAQVGSRA